MGYTWLDYLTMFGATFASICLLGIQSKNVMQSRYIAAVVVSFGISACQFIFTKYAATGDLAAFATCAVGGCLGIACSIWLYDNVLVKIYKKTPEEKTTKKSAIPNFPAVPKMPTQGRVVDASASEAVLELQRVVERLQRKIKRMQNEHHP